MVERDNLSNELIAKAFSLPPPPMPDFSSEESEVGADIPIELTLDELEQVAAARKDEDFAEIKKRQL